ncbi:MAG TPA: RNA 2',3'-cyclic phosphodiesterase, partial [Planctomycetes bacterium]|nr:RNA 2',3'-cyclic phosphodiesterase [Planctomycetota bacterium]
MRLFWAIELDDAARETLAAAQERLAADPAAAVVNWTRPEALHVTLAFLGEVAEERVPELRAAIESLLPVEPLRLNLAHLGSFGGSRPRVVWAGLGGRDRGKLVALGEGVGAALEPLGFPRERRGFAPHVTLGRVRKQRGRGGRALRELLRGTALPRTPFLAHEVVLFASSYGHAQGPARYTALLRLPCGGGGGG